MPQQLCNKHTRACYVLQEKPHSVFTREGNDLYYKHRLTLADALCGHTILLKHLDGKQEKITVSGVCTPNSQKVVKGRGMPSSRVPGQYGDLRITFEIIFPQSLSDQQKQDLRRILPT